MYIIGCLNYTNYQGGDNYLGLTKEGWRETSFKDTFAVYWMCKSRFFKLALDSI